MKRYITIVSWIVLLLLFYPVGGQCLDVDFRGQVYSLFILRDTNGGFQRGFMDSVKGVQWRNVLEFDLTLTPEHSPGAAYYMDKVFMSYRGGYDAIFEMTDRYDDIREKTRDDYELGRDDIEWENDLREIFVDLVAEDANTRVNLRLGRQIVRWGETDLFNIINMPNPNDTSYQMFFSDPDDLAYPLWMGRLNYNVTGVGVFSSIGFEFLAIPDIRPTQLAPMAEEGTDYWNTDAPYAFVFDGYTETFDMAGWHPVFKEDVAANTWDNMEYGMSLLMSIENLEATLHYFVGYQDVGVLDWSDFIFGGGTFGVPGLPLTNVHPRQRTYGFSFNYFAEGINSVIRGEGAYTTKMNLVQTPMPENGFTGMAERTVFQLLLGIDKDLHPTWIGTRSALSTAFEAYWQRIPNLGVRQDPAIFPADKKDTGIGAITMWTDYHHGMIKPFLKVAYDTEGTWMSYAHVQWDPDGKWLFQITQMSFWGNHNALSRYSYAGALISNSELSFKVAYRF